MQEKLKETKGITLVALIITVIILLILAGVTISLVIGKNGLIAKSEESVEKYKDKAKEEQWQLEDFEAGMKELKDEEEYPELKQMKLVLNITEDNKEIQLPVYTYSDNYKYDCTVNWGDGIIEQVTNENIQNAEHTYGATGEYTLVIEGTLENLCYNSSIQKALKKVEQWGSTGLNKISLYNCSNLIQIAEPSKNSFAKIEEFVGTFKECTGLTEIPQNLFANCPNVTSFEATFYKCSNLTGKSIHLWEEGRNGINENSGGIGCYHECGNLEDYDEIPNSWKRPIKPPE